MCNCCYCLAYNYALDFFHFSITLPLPFLQASVRVWLTSIGLVQYEEVLVEAGYDDIDFISDISGDELQDIGITKNGQLLDNIHTYS